MIFLAVALLAAPNSALAGTDWTWKAKGHARIIDGDTIELQDPELVSCPMPSEPCRPGAGDQARSIKVRLHGIDAPESDQVCYDASGAPWACGEAATAYLDALIGTDAVTCFGGGPDMGEHSDRYGRRLSICHVWLKRNLNALMVHHGYALAYRKYSDSFAYAENWARGDCRGMWAGDFMPPWEWRAQR